MNVADSEVVASVMQMAGYEATESLDEADAVFLNTCSVRDNAEQKIYHRLDALDAIKRKRPLIIGVLGCMAERVKDDLLQNHHADLVAGPDAYLSLPDLIAQAETGHKAINIELSTSETYRDIVPQRLHGAKIGGFVSIMRGCNNFCHYCIVPYTRGRERSRDVESILREVRDLRDRGFKEVTLLGQNVNSYSGERLEVRGERILQEQKQPQDISLTSSLSPLTSKSITADAMHDITSALITTTLVFMAVFVPVCFISGVTGTFYTQFGLTMAIAVGISLFNALTLSPALCAIMMRPAQGTHPSGILQRFNDGFNAVLSRYQRAVAVFIPRRWLGLALVVLAVGALVWMMRTTKTGLVPNEDMGTVFINVQASPGSSLQQTYHILKEVEARIEDLPQLRIYSLIAGNSNNFEQSSSNGNFTLKLKKWGERKGKGDDVQSVVDEIYRRTADIANAKIQVNTQNMLPGFGRINGFEMHVQDKHGGTIQDLLTQTNRLIAALNERPEISRAFTNFSLKYPQYRVEVDAALCKRRGVSPSDVLAALSGYVGGSYASNLVRFTKLYRVMVQASPEYRLDTESLNNIFVRNNQGEMSPIGQYITLTRIYGSETLSRFNLFPSIQVGGTAAEGYSSGQAIEAIRETAAEVLPEGYGYEFGGMTREEASAQNTTALVFVICIIFIYLILCALYESLFIPMAVILSVPFGLAGSFLFAWLWGLENNIYMQTGLIMLIGLLSKTAILLTEYASTRRRQGMGIVEAALDAAAVRLRPILMTSLTMVFGLLPLALATGVGANGNRSLGVGVIGGMLIGTIALLFIVPTLFVIFQSIEERFKK